MVTSQQNAMIIFLTGNQNWLSNEYFLCLVSYFRLLSYRMLSYKGFGVLQKYILILRKRDASVKNSSKGWSADIHYVWKNLWFTYSGPISYIVFAKPKKVQSLYSCFPILGHQNQKYSFSWRLLLNFNTSRMQNACKVTQGRLGDTK